MGKSFNRIEAKKNSAFVDGGNFKKSSPRSISKNKERDFTKMFKSYSDIEDIDSDDLFDAADD